MRQSTLYLFLISLLIFNGANVRAQDAKDPLAAKVPADMVYVPGGEFTRGTNKGEGISPTTPRVHNDAQPEAK